MKEKQQKILHKKFFNRPVLEVAEGLIGKYLVREIQGKTEGYMITEVEGYDGERDLACHSSKGKTPRTKVMYEEGGTLYVYLVYGMHEMLNVVTGEKEYPAAVLIRGVEGISGPGRVTKKLFIDRSLNSKSAGKESGLWFEDRGVAIAKKDIKKTPRIGVEYAGPIWSKKPWRFVIKK